MIEKLTKKQEAKTDDDVLTAIKFLKENGCVVLRPKHKTAKGPDLNAIKNDCAYRIEIKKLRPNKGSWVSDPVEANRKNDDFIIIVYKNKIISFESMESHLLKCNSSGSRMFSKEMEILK